MQAQVSEFLGVSSKNKQDTIIHISAVQSLFALISMFVLFGVAWSVVITQLSSMQRQITHVEDTIDKDIKPLVAKIPNIETKVDILWEHLIIKSGAE